MRPVSITLRKTPEGYTVHYVNDPNNPHQDSFTYGYKDSSFRGATGISDAKSLAFMLLEQSVTTDTPVPDLISQFETGEPIPLPLEPKRLTTVTEVIKRWRQMDEHLPRVAQALLSDLP